MSDDPEGLAGVFDVVDDLARDPRPATAFPWGSADLLRLRVGRYRVLYEVDDKVVRIDVIHLGRSG
jgi:mRNA interferase RelE/StbE